MAIKTEIPFLDLVAPHAELRSDLCDVFGATLNTAGFIGGPMVQSFEKDFAAFCGTDYCIGVGSGTDALRFALIAAGVEPGDVVVTVPNTFIATTEAISQAGAKPVFVDIDENTYSLDENKLREYLENACDLDANSGRLVDRTHKRHVSAVIPVHLYGQMADMDPILDLARAYNLIVIEDACQAHGAEYFSKKKNRWCKAGSMGNAAAFSFYPGKNLGACGEGGAVTTNDAEIARKIKMLRDHGQAKKYYHDFEGYNGRLDSIQAGILSVKLKHLPNWSEMRRAVAIRYREAFTVADAQLILPFEPAWSKAVYHIFAVRVDRRDEFMARLASAGIGTGIHYPIPLHLQAAYKDLGYARGDFPISESVAAEIVSLPMYPQLQPEQQHRVVNETLNCVTPFAVG